MTMIQKTITVIQQAYQMAFSVSSIRFDEVSKAFAEKNIEEDHLSIWTDFERLNISHFR